MSSSGKPHVIYAEIPEDVWRVLRTLDHGMRKPLIVAMLTEFCKLHKVHNHMAAALILDGKIGLGYNNTVLSVETLYGTKKESK